MPRASLPMVLTFSSVPASLSRGPKYCKWRAIKAKKLLRCALKLNKRHGTVISEIDYDFHNSNFNCCLFCIATTSDVEVYIVSFVYQSRIG